MENNTQGMNIQAKFTIPFTQVQNSVIESPYFKRPIDKMVYINLLKFAFNKGYAFPSIKTIALMQNVSENTVRSSIKRLEEMKLVKVEKRSDEKLGNLSNLYYVYDLSYEHTMEHYKEEQEKNADTSSDSDPTSNIEVGGFKNLSRGVQKFKYPTSKIEAEEESFNNTKFNNINMNNNLSIEDSKNNVDSRADEKEEKEIDRPIDDKLILQNKISEKKNLPIPVAKPMMIHTQRLIDDGIDIEDIISTYYANKEVINEYQFGNILSNVLYETKGKIRNIRGLLHTSIKNYFKDINEIEHLKEQRPKEILPDWFVKKEHEKQEPVEDNPYNLEGARDRFSDIFNF